MGSLGIFFLPGTHPSIGHRKTSWALLAHTPRPLPHPKGLRMALARARSAARAPVPFHEGRTWPTSPADGPCGALGRRERESPAHALAVGPFHTGGEPADLHRTAEIRLGRTSLRKGGHVHQTWQLPARLLQPRHTARGPAAEPRTPPPCP